MSATDTLVYMFIFVLLAMILYSIVHRISSHIDKNINEGVVLSGSEIDWNATYENILAEEEEEEE